MLSTMATSPATFRAMSAITVKVVIALNFSSFPSVTDGIKININANIILMCHFQEVE